ncbi:lipopolysaccharide biosynthesis protein [Vibrio breoganii]|uniref:lipopolysaccharide biosynthesis protein n=1 Tax=Vibrio breoganii TaxID=553239 RepID=UPI0012FFE686|nr:lipopolysaccharide biosynthesis protein [Vibrio breoganii]
MKSSLKWSALERVVVQSIQLLTMIFLARELGPKAYGLIGMLAIFLAVFQIFIDSGFSAALIRKVDRTEEDIATAFYFNLLVSVISYVVFYTVAPAISKFYGQTELINIARVSGIILVINSLVMIQKTLLTIEMDFKTIAKASVISVLLSSTISVALVFQGYGVWVLVIQSISMALFNTILLNVFYPWKPKAKFSTKAFKNLFGFGSKLLISSFIDTVYSNIYQLLIGKMFNASDLGLFTQAKNLSSLPAITFSTIIQRVTFPYLSKFQNDNNLLESNYSRIIEVSAFIIFPIFTCMSLMSKDVIVLILGEEWQEASLMFSILCICFMVYPIQSLNLNLLKVKGRSDLFLKLEVIKKILLTIVLFLTVPNGLIAICLGMLVHSLLSLGVNTYYTGIITSLGLKEQIRFLIPIVLCCIISLVAVHFITTLLSNMVVSLFVATITMFIVYLVSSFIFSRSTLFFLLSNVKF